MNDLKTSLPITRRRALGALAGGAVLLLAACGGPATLTGTDLGKTPAPDFTLTDQRGETVKLSSYRGKAVVLTFLYTNCTDVCPLTAEALHATSNLLSAKVRDNVELLAVTVDPARDTDAAIQAFSAKHGLADDPNWHFMRGTEAQLQPVWQAYHIDARQIVADEPGTPESVNHTDAVYVIDTKGQERVLLHSDLDPKKLASDLKTLVD